MKISLWIILLTTSFHALSNGALILRGRVPASFTIDSTDAENPIIKSNSNAKSLAPKVVVTEFKKHTRITIIQR